MINKIRIFFINIYIGFRNLFEYFGVIYKDRDWDDWYFLELMEFKIRRMRNHIDKTNMFVGSEDVVKRMDLILRLLHKVKEEEYESEIFDYYESKIHFDEVPDKEPKMYSLRSEELNNKLHLYFKNHKSAAVRLKIKKKRKYTLSEAIKLSHNRQNKASELLFKLIGSEYRKWWN